MRAKQLVKGKVEYKDGYTEEGVYEYFPKVEEMHLKKGKMTFADGPSHNGLFEYIEELDSFCLVEGISIFKSGIAFEGKWQYIPQLKRMEVRLSRVFPAKCAFIRVFYA